ncbi:MAG: nuclear transport factor 2 family protein [Chitinophagaceae bacterium]
MNIRLLIPLLSICFASCVAKQANYSIESKKLLDLEKEAITREFKNDTAFLSSIMDTTFIELSKEKIKNKHEVLKTIHSNNMRNISNKITLDSFVLEDPVVHLYDNSAVVTFIMHTYRKKNKIPYENRTRFYDVWVKRNNKWKAVSWQASSIE